MEVSRLLLQAEVHPEWKVWWAAVERWAREVWISRHRRPGGFPADALLEGELEMFSCHGKDHRPPPLFAVSTRLPYPCRQNRGRGVLVGRCGFL